MKPGNRVQMRPKHRKWISECGHVMNDAKGTISSVSQFGEDGLGDQFYVEFDNAGLLCVDAWKLMEIVA